MPSQFYPPVGSPDPSSVETSNEGTARTFTTEQLFLTESEVRIQHGKKTYRLRITKAAKLILNK